MAEIRLYHEQLAEDYESKITHKLMELGVPRNLFHFGETRGSICLRVDNPSFKPIIDFLKDLDFEKDTNYIIIFGLKETYDG